MLIKTLEITVSMELTHTILGTNWSVKNKMLGNYHPSLDLTAYRNSKKHGTNFFRYVNASVISFKLHFTAILFHLSGLRLFPLNLVCLFVFFSFTNLVCFLPYRYIYYFS